jgi:hypothetical protein
MRRRDGKRPRHAGLATRCVRGLLPVLGACVLRPVGPLAAQTPVYSDTVEQWGMQEVAVTSSRTYANPFTDVTLACRFRSGETEVVASGFYDGHGTWKVRLMPDVRGTWTFTTVSRDPNLDRKTGSFQVIAPGPDNHGPVRVRDTYHFGYADGAEYFPVGTTTYGGVGGDARNRLRTVNLLSHSPFNKTRFQVLPAGFGSEGRDVLPFEVTASGTPDYGRPNPQYYAEIESSLRDLQALGIEADAILFTPYDQQPGGRSNMGATNDEAYLRYVVARLAAFRNVWWTLTNEFDLYASPKDWNRLGTLVSQSDPYKHLLGIHNCCTAFYDNSQPWIDHAILQDITLQRLTAAPRNLTWLELDARKIGKPVMVDEYGYEGNYGTTWGSFSGREIVEMHWAITLAGAYASHGESFAENGAAPDHFIGEAPPRLAFLKQIMMEAPYRQMEPAPDIMSGDDPNVSILAKRGSYYLIAFWPPREVATWNLGFFGPATPSRPLPAKPFDFSAFVASLPKSPEFQLGDGVFRVDLIDPWLMKVTMLGYTNGPTQHFRARITPGIVRLVRVDHPEPGAPLGTVSELMTGQRRR